jgi:hypothetical protein
VVVQCTDHVSPAGTVKLTFSPHEENECMHCRVETPLPEKVARTCGDELGAGLEPAVTGVRKSMEATTTLPRWHRLLGIATGSLPNLVSLIWRLPLGKQGGLQTVPSEAASQ